MTLYHYVATKDELLALVSDAIMGEILIPPEELPQGWRAGMREIARRTRDALVRHRWVAEMPHNADEGPNGARHAEQTLAVMFQTGLDRAECLELCMLVDDYVFGYIERFNTVNAAMGDAAGRTWRNTPARSRPGSPSWTRSRSRTCTPCSASRTRTGRSRG